MIVLNLAHEDVDQFAESLKTGLRSVLGMGIPVRVEIASDVDAKHDVFGDVIDLIHRGETTTIYIGRPALVREAEAK